LHLDGVQYKVQYLVDRKTTSSYYTNEDGVAVIREFLKNVKQREGIIIIDPFMGSGVLLSSVHDLFKPSKVIGIEINKEPCKLAHKILSSLYQNVEIICDDAFKTAWKFKADIILSNPPFVRWHLINNREEILRIIQQKGYDKFITRNDPGLHILSFFLMDYILKEGGYMALVMPASAFYTKQGEGLKKLLKIKYDILAIVENKRNPAFSSGSGFKELILFLRKKENTLFPNSTETDIFQWNGKLNKIGSINLVNLPKFADRNWLSVFDMDMVKKLIKIIEEGLERGLLRFLKKNEILRGIEMYGPDFFFLPNKYWKIIGEDEEYKVIRNVENSTKLRIPSQYLIECLRKPEYYKQIEIKNADFYALAINDEPSGDLQQYIEWGEKLNIPALQFGKYWYKHIWNQLKSKKPYGHIFIHDKIDMRTHDVLANYSKRPLCASKDFYIIKEDNPLIVAWYNSSIMKILLKTFSRRISETWTRFLEEDYLAIPIPSKIVSEIDFNNIDTTIEKYLEIDIKKLRKF